MLSTSCYTYSMVNETLQKLGLNDKEVAIYTTVLQQGKITPANVAKLTKINRTTVYSVSKDLIKKGFVSEDLAGPASYLVARPPQDLKFVIDKEEQELNQKRRLVNKAIDELQLLTKNVKYSIPKIVFISEEGLGDYLYKQTPIWDESIQKTKSIWWGFQDKTFVRHYEQWIDWYWETGGSKNMELQLISNESAEALKKKKFPRRHIKFWNKSQDFTATTWILGDYVVMIVTAERPHYLVEIHDAVLAHNMRELFKGLWEQAN
jgi:sugar-specific transcriptional regulator TrmB